MIQTVGPARRHVLAGARSLVQKAIDVGSMHLSLSLNPGPGPVAGMFVWCAAGSASTPCELRGCVGADYLFPGVGMARYAVEAGDLRVNVLSSEATDQESGDA